MFCVLSDTRSVSPYIYIGCYGDTGLRAVTGGVTNVPSIESCAQRAVDQSFKMFGFQLFTVNSNTRELFGILSNNSYYKEQYI